MVDFIYFSLSCRTVIIKYELLFCIGECFLKIKLLCYRFTIRAELQIMNSLENVCPCKSNSVYAVVIIFRGNSALVILIVFTL